MDVTVVAKGAGGLHLSPGTIDVLGYAPDRVDEPGPAVARLVDERPDHPYARLAPEPLGGGAGVVPRAGAGARATRATPERNLLLPTAVGVARPTRARARQHRRRGPARRRALRGRGARSHEGLLPGAAGRQPAARRPAGRRPRRGAAAGDHHVRPARARRRGRAGARPRPRRPGTAPGARRRAAPPARARRDRGDAGGARAAIGAGEAWDDLQDLLGAPVVEIPTLPPSVPGMRLQKALLEALRARPAGGLVLGPPAVGVRGRGRAADRRAGARRGPHPGAPGRRRGAGDGRLRGRRPRARLARRRSPRPSPGCR